MAKIKIIRIISEFFNNKRDPVKRCRVHKDMGCSHVDGPICTYPSCSALVEYKRRWRVAEDRIRMNRRLEVGGTIKTSEHAMLGNRDSKIDISGEVDYFFGDDDE
jgi:hypothetical protein